MAVGSPFNTRWHSNPIVEHLIESVVANARARDLFSQETGFWRLTFGWSPKTSFLDYVGVNKHQNIMSTIQYYDSCFFLPENILAAGLLPKVRAIKGLTRNSGSSHGGRAFLDWQPRAT